MTKYVGTIWVITGTRAANSGVPECLDGIMAHFGEPNSVYVGDANGVDDQATKWARSKGIGVKVFVADWIKYGPSAGPIRNRKMLKEAERYSQMNMCVAFPLGGAQTRSKCAWDCIHQAASLGMGVMITPLMRRMNPLGR